MEISGEIYLTSKEAASKAGCTADHVTRLCRQNIVKNCRIGKKWYIHERYFLDFIGKQVKEKSFKNIDLSEKRTREFKVKQLKFRETVESVENDIISEARDIADYILSHIMAIAAAVPIYIHEQFLPLLRLIFTGGYRYPFKYELPALLVGLVLMGGITTYLFYMIDIYTTVVQASN